MAQKLSVQDRKDMDKFTKFLALKATQIIVQSRLGEKVSTPCKPNTGGTDWFNLAVNDLPEVLAEAKRAINGEVITTRLPLCVEISLKTVEGDHMVLETWYLNIIPDECDSSIQVINVYNRMGILLKSLVSVTRVTPAYKLSRRQGPDSYVICYRIYLGEPQLHGLGDNFKQVRIGQLCTPIGTLQLSVSYRTKMTISPTQTGKENSMMLKSDHFNTNLSPRHARYRHNDEKKTSLSDTPKFGAFADINKKNIEPEMIIPDLPFSKLIISERPSQESPPPPSTKDDEDCSKTILLEDQNGNSPTEKPKAALTLKPTNDDFIMVELKTPFASTNANTELGLFYKEWQSAPPLQAFVDVPTLAEQVQDLTKQLESFESDMREYEDVLQSLCQSPNNN